MKKLLFPLVMSLMALTSQAQTYHLDANNDGSVELTDALIIVDYVLGRFNPDEGNAKVYLTCPDDHHPHMIDLGLPSGTKWACCNVGATTPEGYGGYYAWGETWEKSEYTWESYSHCDGTQETCHDLGSDIAGTKYDVAHVKWGGSWVMPSIDQIRELLGNCSSEWTTVNGINGWVFTGSNGGRIFLPAAGYRGGSGLGDAGSGGNYWSSTQYPSYAPVAYSLYFYSYGTYVNDHGYRYYGQSVRPVASGLTLSSSSLSLVYGEEGIINITSGSGSYSVKSSDAGVATASLTDTSVKVTAVGAGTATITVRDTMTGQTATVEVKADYLPLTLSDTSLTLFVGENSTSNITSGNGNFTVRSSDTNVATATLSGYSVKITAVAAGTAAVTVTDNHSGTATTIAVTVRTDQEASLCPDSHHPHMIDLGLPSGTKWACCNVDPDASKQSPINYGGYYAWGETCEKNDYSWDSYSHCDGTQETCHDLGSDIAGTKYDVAHVKWGGSWVMPSRHQFQELLDNCSSEWTTVNGINGRVFTGSNGGRIFLPAAGDRYDSDLGLAGWYGFYWSSTQSPSGTNYAYSLYFDSGRTNANNSYYRGNGLTVRPVSRN